MANAELLKKLKAASTIDETSILKDSFVFEQHELISTPVPMLNVALSGALDGGFASGLTMFAGESKRFKTLFVLMCAASYLKKFPDAILLFYDSEFGTPQAYFESLGISLDRVIHTPITTVEQLRSDIANQLKSLKRGDKVFIAIDSIGNLASSKEVNDALEEKTVADMTRAKQIKSLFRIVTPQLTLKDVPCFVVNHTYKTQEMYSKDVVSGGTGVYYSSGNIFIIGRQQEKDDEGLSGFNFIINVEKSRFVREKSKIPVSVSFEEGVQRNSGLVDLAFELNWIAKPKMGWYAFVNRKTGEVEDKLFRKAEGNKPEFANRLLEDADFQEAVKDKFQIARTALFKNEEEN